LVDEPVADRNRASAERLRALTERLAPDQLRAEIDPPWTGAALFAHIAFWDRFVRQRWKLAKETGRTIPSSVDDRLMDSINDAALPQWLGVEPEASVSECLAAAAEVDAFVAALERATLSELGREGRPRLADRSIHRLEHLATLEAALRP
jgi:hypothetical protein